MAKSIGIELAWWSVALWLSAWPAHGAPYSVPPVLQKSGAVETGTIRLPNLRAGAAYSVLYSVRSPRALAGGGRIGVAVVQGGAVLVEKTLHLGDPDLYAMFHVPRNGAAGIRVSVQGAVAAAAGYRLAVNRWPDSSGLEKEPNNRWQDANPIALGSTVFASGDETPYIPLPGSESGFDWFRFDFREPRPKLVFFQIDLMERDNLPVDVAVFRVVDGKATPFTDGEDPVALPHEVQALPGNKFTTRVLKENGTYYVRVRANHPEYKLRTREYDPPPYADPQQAVQTAVDYIMGAGDSWHANTPRRGGIFDRVSNVHQETSLCVACHPTHFSQRAQLYAVRNGYEVHQRQQLQFLSERFYNNPRPFYGFEKEGAVWARVISAPANVLSRMSVLLDLFESEVARERRDWYHAGVAQYLKLYYKDRDKLPPDETNGNTPLVSAYEVAWYSWRVTRDPRIASLIGQDAVRNMVDLCYQTLALADIDAVKYREKIQRNAERILALQRPDGQWAMRFEPEQLEAEFQTGHALWALQAAGVPREHPQVAKAIRYLLSRQQPFGGWMDPLQSYENFRTPFRETQMSVLALSAYYPKGRRAVGWHSTVQELPRDPVELLQALDNIWDEPPRRAIEQVKEAAVSNDVLIRQAALEALGRIAHGSSAALVASALGDESKLAQRTAAWALRQIYSRRQDTPARDLEQALADPNDRTRWGATRVFAVHFSALARRSEFTGALARLAADPVPTVRMQALKGLWQLWFWTADEAAKDRIENTFLAAAAEPQHPWVDQNVREGIYNIADENIRYFYNNWVPLLASVEDRERAIRGRLSVEDRLARKFSEALERGTDLQRKTLLAGLAEFPLRRGDAYDLEADHTRPAGPVYSRIGNDIEQSVFFGASNDRFARALLPLLNAPDGEIRRLALEASLLSRKANFPGVNQVAGAPGADYEALRAGIEKHRTDAPEVVKAFVGAPPRAAGERRAVAPAARYGKPSETYFRAHVEPILTARGRDGNACVHCHISHTLFNATYATALNAIDLNDPENSLILRKPTSSSETEGTLGARTLSHGGGVRWERNSPEYQTILNWIKGAER